MEIKHKLSNFVIVYFCIISVLHFPACNAGNADKLAYVSLQLFHMCGQNYGLTETKKRFTTKYYDVDMNNGVAIWRVRKKH